MRISKFEMSHFVTFVLLALTVLQLAQIVRRRLLLQTLYLCGERKFGNLTAEARRTQRIRNEYMILNKKPLGTLRLCGKLFASVLLFDCGSAALGLCDEKMCLGGMKMIRRSAIEKFGGELCP
jgi:hypothetical protein